MKVHVLYQDTHDGPIFYGAVYSTAEKAADACVRLMAVPDYNRAGDLEVEEVEVDQDPKSSQETYW